MVSLFITGIIFRHTTVHHSRVLNVVGEETDSTRMPELSKFSEVATKFQYKEYIQRGIGAVVVRQKVEVLWQDAIERKRVDARGRTSL